AKGYCLLHLRRFRKTGDPLRPSRPRSYNGKPCNAPGCDREAHSSGFCEWHAGMIRRRGSLNASQYEYHGKYNTPEYLVWKNIKQRTTNATNKAYKNYGARGIAMCGRWRDSFKAFLEDMG